MHARTRVWQHCLYSRVLGHHMGSADFLNLSMATQSLGQLKSEPLQAPFLQSQRFCIIYQPLQTDLVVAVYLCCRYSGNSWDQTNLPQFLYYPNIPLALEFALRLRKSNLSQAHEKPWHWRGTESAKNKLEMKRDLSRAATTQRKIMFWSSWPFWRLTSWLITKNFKDCYKWLIQLF